jgi:hypothetical protein
MVAVMRNIEARVEHHLQQGLAFGSLKHLVVNRHVDGLGRITQVCVRCHEVAGRAMAYPAARFARAPVI